MRQSILKMDKCEVWDLTEALYTFAVLNHSGIYSDLYALQCVVGNYFKPGMGWSESDTEDNNMFYHELTEENAGHIWNRVRYVLDNRWDDMD